MVITLHTLFIMIHAVTGSVALLVGGFSFSKKSYRPRYVFAYLSLLSLLAGIFVIGEIEEGLGVQSAFVILSFLWLFFSIKILTSSKKQSYLWFVRSYVLVLFFISVRIWRALFFFIGFSYSSAYAWGAWFGLVGNLILGEYLVRLTQ